MPNEEIGFRPVDASHYAMLAAWLERPHMRRWWGEPAAELGHIRDMVEGRDTTRPFLIEYRGRPVGYIQYWFVGHHQNAQWLADHPWLCELRADAVGVDLSIGEPDFLSRGLGSAALAGFCTRLREAGHATIVIDPDPENARAIRAYEKAGFRAIAHLKDRTDGVLLMQHLADTEET